VTEWAVFIIGLLLAGGFLWVLLIGMVASAIWTAVSEVFKSPSSLEEELARIPLPDTGDATRLYLSPYAIPDTPAWRPLRAAICDSDPADGYSWPYVSSAEDLRSALAWSGASVRGFNGLPIYQIGRHQFPWLRDL
jgi:hypothetical protein